MNKPGLIIAFLITLIMLGCASENTNQVDDSKPVSKPDIGNVDKGSSESKNQLVTATVKYINLEGGFYGLITEQGEKLLPMNLPIQARSDGSIIRFKVRIITDMMSIQQWGKMVELIDVEVISSTQQEHL